MDSIKDHQLRFSRRTFLASTGVLAGSTLLAGCDFGSNTTTSITSSNDAGAHTIALITGNKPDPFYVTMGKGAQAQATTLGTHLLIDGPGNFDPALQIPIVESMIAKKVHAIIIAACDKQKLIAPLQRAHDAGIIVISVDTFIGDGNYSNGLVTFPLTYIGSDNVAGGRIAGIALIKGIGGAGKVYVQSTSLGASTTDQRAQGFTEAVNATNGLVTLVKTDYNNHDTLKASIETSTLLQQIDNVVGIFCTNDASGEGAALGVKAAGKQGIVKIANFDAPEKAITDLRNGVINIVIAQKPGDMGSLAVEYAVNVLNGNTSGLKKHVPTGFVIIDRDNVDTPEAQSAIYQSN